MKNLFKIIPILLISLTTLQSCNNNDDENVEDVSTIVNLAVDSADLTSLVAALDRANLVSTLNGEGPFTVLAPTNDAFAAFLSANNFNSLEDVPVDILTKVLLNHVISGSLISTDLSTGYANTLATSAASQTPLSIYVDTSNGVKFNGVSSVSAADILAVNGVIHKVDEVIGLPNIVTFATADPNFSTLVSALTRTDLTTDFVGVLSTDSATAPAPFTVFAPINDAFNRLLTELNLTSLSQIDEPTLDVVLKNHVVGGANVLDSNLTDNLTINTLGGDITADISGGARLTDSSGRVSNIIATNVQADNGVIHAINKVILPLQQPTTNNIVDVAVGSENLSTLVAALERADLVTTLANQGPFTVLAPSNEAFNTFLSDNGFNNIDDVPVDVLNNILRNHVVGGRLESTDLTTGYASTFATTPASDANMSIFIDISNGVKFNGISSVTDADISADNGIVHVVDAVIGLPTIATFATSNNALSNLVDALAYADTGNPTVPYISTVSDATAGPFTVFAPTNDAFADLLTELNATALTDLSTSAVDDVLLYHIVGANVLSGQLTTGTVETLGGNITVDTSNFTLTDPNNRVSNIITTLVDIQAMNGVLHVIDKVILPLQ